MDRYLRGGDPYDSERVEEPLSLVVGFRHEQVVGGLSASRFVRVAVEVRERQSALREYHREEDLSAGGPDDGVELARDDVRMDTMGGSIVSPTLKASGLQPLASQANQTQEVLSQAG